MAIDYRKTAEELVRELGGDGNISRVTHCATRLRFVLKDDKRVDKERVSKIPGVITVVQAGGQFQVVIGNHVADAFRHVSALVHTDGTAGEEPKKKGNVFGRIIDVISSIFAPFLYTLAACGILQGILGVLVALGWINTGGGTYQILNFVSWTAFTFLPVLIAITASKKFNMDTFVAVVIACALVCPDYMRMVEAGQAVAFLGMPVHLLSYTSTVIPIILAIWVASYLQRFWNKVLPLVIRNLFSPLFTIAIMVPLTLLAFGPVGNAVGGAIGDVYNDLYNLSPIVAGVVVGGLWEVLVIFGVHWGITPVTVGNYAHLGYDTFTGLQASAVFSQAGAAFGVALKSKDKDMKKMALSAGVTGLFGITEPAIYGVNLRLKRPMICGCIAGAVGGGIAGAFHAVSWSYNMPGIATLPAYFKTGYTGEFIGLLLSIAVSFVLAAVLTWFAGFREEAPATTPAPAINPDDGVPLTTQAAATREIGCPAAGRLIPLHEVQDAAFASGDMGPGVGILADEGRVYAPYDGEVEMVTDTGHAVELISPDGVETILHIGIDTVKMQGRGFTTHVKIGDKVKRGDWLVTFDQELLKQEGFDTTVIFVATGVPQGKRVRVTQQERAGRLEPIMMVDTEGTV